MPTSPVVPAARGLAVLVACVASPLAVAQDTLQDFEAEGAGTAWESWQGGAEPAVEVRDGTLWLLNGMRARGPLANGVGFARTAEGARQGFELTAEFVLSKGAHGAAFALLDTSAYGESGPPPAIEAWEEPNAPGVLALALDVYDPPTAHWFDEHGNVHDRPQRTLSLHADGLELWGGLSPVEFRDGDGHELRWAVDYVPGGAYVDVSIDGEALLERRFFAHLAPFEARLAVAGRTGDVACNALVDDLRVAWGEVAGPAPDVEVVTAFDRELVNGSHRHVKRAFALPDPARPVARVLLDYTLAEPAGGWDQWDRKAGIEIWLGQGEARRKVELIRTITPFRRAWTWSVDVTHLLPWLRGEVELEAWADSWLGGKEEPTQGFLVTTTFTYVYAEPERRVLAAVPLWQRNHDFGGAGNTPEGLAAAFPEMVVPVPADATSALVELIVSGHGGFGEFTPALRELHVNGEVLSDRLWNEEVWLNPVRPQSGTWKFDRAAWAPGSVVEPWVVDVSALLEPGGELRLQYVPVPFDVVGGDASHLVAGRVVLFGDA